MCGVGGGFHFEVSLWKIQKLEEKKIANQNQNRILQYSKSSFVFHVVKNMVRIYTFNGFHFIMSSISIFFVVAAGFY